MSKRWRRVDPSEEEVAWWLIEDSKPYKRYLKGARKAGHKFPAPTAPTVDAPPVFKDATAWIHELGADAVGRHDKTHREDQLFLAAHWGVLDDERDPLLDVRGDDKFGEFNLRRAAQRAELQQQYRARVMSQALTERDLTTGLTRLEAAGERLLSAMKENFRLSWHWRSEIARIAWPTLDLSVIRTQRYDLDSPLARLPLTNAQDAGIPPALGPKALES